MLRQVIAAVALLLLSSVAQAQIGKGSSALTWMPADSYTDGSFMFLGEQRIYAARTLGTTCGVAPAVEVFTQLQVVAAGVSAFTVQAQWNGGWYYYATSIDIFGNESGPSNVACKSINIAGNWTPPGVGVRPNPPGNLRAE